MPAHFCVRVLHLASFILIAFATGAHAEADGPDYFRVTGVRANDVLNLRAAPSATSAIRTAIPHDAYGLRNLGCRGEQSFAEWQRSSPEQRRVAANRRWRLIEYRGVTGWANGRFLSE